MYVFWEPVVWPMLNWLKPNKIVEIGALHGDHTARLLGYCQIAGAELYTIDPYPAFDVGTFQAIHGRRFHMLPNFSLQVLHQIDNYDFVLIDGDHNWYTVYNELKTIEREAVRRGAFPAVLVHDTEWPYGRRDMYYFPETIPEPFRHPYERKGVVPGQSALVTGGVNDGSCHAVFENGARNGVLTAIEDFLKETALDLAFYRVIPHHGLGILIPNRPDLRAGLHGLLAQSGLSFLADQR